MLTSTKLPEKLVRCCHLAVTLRDRGEGEMDVCCEGRDRRSHSPVLRQSSAMQTAGPFLAVSKRCHGPVSRKLCLRYPAIGCIARTVI